MKEEQWHYFTYLCTVVGSETSLEVFVSRDGVGKNLINLANKQVKAISKKKKKKLIVEHVASHRWVWLARLTTKAFKAKEAVWSDGSHSS